MPRSIPTTGFFCLAIVGLIVTVQQSVAADVDPVPAEQPTVTVVLPSSETAFNNGHLEAESDVEYEDTSVVRLTDYFEMNQPLPLPLAPAPSPRFGPSGTTSTRLSDAVFSSGETRISLLNQSRQALARAPGSEVVFGTEGQFRATSDMGSLLGKSLTKGIAAQRRTPIVSDPRIRGDRMGRLLASGSYWAPARQDLDTMLSKIDSRIIDDMIVIKGPYAVRYGPGFDFVDFQLLGSPRFECGPCRTGSTSLEYQTNGAQFYGRTRIEAGSNDWGIRIGYGHRTGNDNDTGGAANGSFFQPQSLPTSYNSRNFDMALGFDLSERSSIEFSYLRLDQTGVEFPGMVFDLRYLKTDGFEVKYVEVDQPGFDRFTLESWYNQTRFEGDTFGAGKNTQIPSLATNLRPFGVFGVAGNAITDVEAISTGSRATVTWGQPGDGQLSVGSDVIFLKQELNDIEDPAGVFPVFLPGNNFPIPRSHTVDVGLFVEHETPVNDCLTFNTGARVDFVEADARDFTSPPIAQTFTPAGHATIQALKASGLDQTFTLWSVFATADYLLNDIWTLKAGCGYAERPPTLTELYASGSFIGTLQPGLTLLEGDPQLDSEKRLQVDLGLAADYGPVRYGANGFYAWIHDHITYDHRDGPNGLLGAGFAPGQEFQQLNFANTDLATLAGVELFADVDLTCYLTGFATLSYVEGRDHTRSEASRIGGLRRSELPGLTGNEPRSNTAGAEAEPLPSIPPLESRIGLRLHEPVPDPLWGLELSARIVDNQDRVALSLSEQATPGFTIWDVRGYARMSDSLLFIAGVENLGDKFYREHLDFRSGRGVFRPGVSFYFSTEWTY